MAENILLAVKFRIRGVFRFLSHAETLRLFQRACLRAGIKISYSHGFNPRPKLSLPLPRSVGVESDDELLSIRLDIGASLVDTEALKSKLAEQLPEGMELISVCPAESKKALQPVAAAYRFVLPTDFGRRELKTKIDGLLQSEHIQLERRIDARGNTKNIDVRDFLQAFELDEKGLIVHCNIRPTGTVRVDEILGLLDLEIEKLERPPKRIAVKYGCN